VDARGLHSFVCKRAPGKTSRNHALNDLVACAFVSAGIPATKEPHGLTRSDGKRPDGLTLVPWQRGKPLSWDVTVICTLADSYTGIYSQVGEICGLRGPIWLPASCSGDIVSSKWIGMRISQQPRPENWWKHWRRSVGWLFVSTDFCFGSAFQRGFAKWQFYVGTPSGLVFIPATTISLTFCSTFWYFLSEGLK